LLVTGLAVAVVLALAGFMVAHARAAVCHVTGDRIIWAEQETQEEGVSQSPPPDLLSRADQLAVCGEGQLLVLASAGQGAVQAGPAVSLVVYREPGEVENDPTARQRGVQTIVDAAFAKAQAVRPPDPAATSSGCSPRSHPSEALASPTCGCRHWACRPSIRPTCVS